MLAIKRSVAIIAILFSPLSAASNLTSQLHTFFSAQLAGVSDEVRVSIRTAPNLLPPCEQPLLSMSNNSRLWGNVNVLARCGNDKRYLQVNVQATGNYVVAAMPIVRGGKLEAGNVKHRDMLSDTPGVGPNPPFHDYSTEGPKCDPKEGLKPLRLDLSRSRLCFLL